MSARPIVEPGVRYACAWAELNARITQRQALITIFTSIALAATGAALASPYRDVAWRAIYAIPLMGLLFAVLLRMHERQIALLRSFLSDLEALPGSEELPKYHSESPRSNEAHRARRPHDHVCLALVLGFTLVSAAIWMSAYLSGHVSVLDVLFSGLLAGCALVSFWVIFGIESMHQKASAVFLQRVDR
jgi:VanZ family protein